MLLRSILDSLGRRVRAPSTASSSTPVESHRGPCCGPCVDLRGRLVLETPVSAFLKVNNGGHAFLLESVEGGQRLARYSFIGVEPYRVATTAGEARTDTLPIIAEELNKYEIVSVAGLPRFCGGAEIGSWFKVILPRDSRSALPGWTTRFRGCRSR